MCYFTYNTIISNASLAITKLSEFKQQVKHEGLQCANPGQTPVVTDQALFANMKLLQWTMDSRYGEVKFFIYFLEE